MHDPLVITQGDTVVLGAMIVLADGNRLPILPRWASSDTQVVKISSGSAIGVASGKASITAAIDSPSLRAEASAVVLGALADSSGHGLIVRRFFMTEFQYESAPGRWFYAPQIQAVAAPKRSVFISQLVFSIPGLEDPIPGWICNALITGDKPVELDGEVYGDWAIAFEGAGQATGADATARITYTDDAGITSTLTIHGPIVRGSLPGTYGGDPGACFHGIS
jgi:hypothetical protein